MHKDKKVIVFDLDGTLAESKSSMDAEMSTLLSRLLEQRIVAVMSGGSYAQFQKQFLGSLGAHPTLLENLFLFPTCATIFYRFQNGSWNNVYSQLLDDVSRNKIKDAFSNALVEAEFAVPTTLYGDLLEDRGTQITFSALGQQAPVEEKRLWDPDLIKRKKIVSVLERYIPEFEIRIGGATSIDVTSKGIHKAYGMEQIEKVVSIPRAEMLFIGDALFPGGNDYPVFEAGIACLPTEGPEETKRHIRSLIS